jgi:hypothetical protein
MVAVFGGAIGPPPDQSDTFPESLELRRAVSRLIEIRSRDYPGAGTDIIQCRLQAFQQRDNQQRDK